MRGWFSISSFLTQEKWVIWLQGMAFNIQADTPSRYTQMTSFPPLPSLPPLQHTPPQTPSLLWESSLLSCIAVPMVAIAHHPQSPHTVAQAARAQR